MLLERVERQALADRTAEVSVAVAERWEDYTPLSVEDRIEAFDKWLVSDPGDTEDARAERHVRELMGVA